MGTVIDVSIYHEEPEPLLDQVEALLHTYNKRFSANDDSSELMKINKAAGLHSVTVHPELFELISLGKWHSCQPGSHLNIAIGPLIQTWRIGFSDAKLPLPEEIRPLLDIINPNAILLSEENQSVFLKEKGMKIDLGALAKGYIADRIADFLKAERTFEIDGKTYHHIFDSQTGYPVSSDLASLTIISSLSVDGEIWTTRLFGSSLEHIFQEVSSQAELEAIIVDKDNHCFQTGGIYKMRIS